MPDLENLFDLSDFCWPYPVKYGKENEIDSYVLVVGGGITGYWAAISSARRGLRVVLIEKGSVIYGGSAGGGIDHWFDAAANPASKISPDELAQDLVNSRNNTLYQLS